MKLFSQPVEFFACRTLSSTIFSGHGSSRSALLSPITAIRPTSSEGRCGRSRARIVSRFGESGLDFDDDCCIDSAVEAKLPPIGAAVFVFTPPKCCAKLLLWLDADRSWAISQLEVDRKERFWGQLITVPMHMCKFMRLCEASVARRTQHEVKGHDVSSCSRGLSTANAPGVPCVWHSSVWA